MAELKVNTDAAVRAADGIRTCNAQLRDGFSDVESAINRLDNFWEGKAATAAIGKFWKMKSDYCEPRYNVLNNYVNFLMKQVNEGYTQTEKANTTLADTFK